MAVNLTFGLSLPSGSGGLSGAAKSPLSDVLNVSQPVETKGFSFVLSGQLQANMQPLEVNGEVPAEALSEALAALTGDGKPLPQGGKILPGDSGGSQSDEAEDVLLATPAVGEAVVVAAASVAPQPVEPSAVTVPTSSTTETAVTLTSAGSGPKRQSDGSNSRGATAASLLVSGSEIEDPTTVAKKPEPPPARIATDTGETAPAQTTATTTQGTRFSELWRELGGAPLVNAAKQSSEEPLAAASGTEVSAGKAVQSANAAGVAYHAHQTQPPPAVSLPVSTAQVPAMPAGVGGPNWSEALAHRVSWMLEGQLGRAEIALDPPELGPLQVRISTQHDQAQVHFVSHHAPVRDALDQALPRLRDMLESQGVQLVDVDVRDQGQQAQQGDSGEAADTSEAARSTVGDEETGKLPVSGEGSLLSRRGLVDAYV